MDTNAFLTQLDHEKGLAPINRFVAKITFPKKISGNDAEKLSYLCDSAPLPGRTIATSELRHYGPTRKLAREATYAEFQLGFIVTNRMAARRRFSEWMDLIIDPETANIEWQDNYKGQVEILMFDQQADAPSKENAIAGAKYLECYPTNMDPIALGWDQINQVGKFSVNFAYKRWIDYMAQDSGVNIGMEWNQ